MSRSLTSSWGWRPAPPIDFLSYFLSFSPDSEPFLLSFNNVFLFNWGAELTQGASEINGGGLRRTQGPLSPLNRLLKTSTTFFFGTDISELSFSPAPQDLPPLYSFGNILSNSPSQSWIPPSIFVFSDINRVLFVLEMQLFRRASSSGSAARVQVDP